MSTEQKMEKTLSHPFDAFLMVRLEFIIICDDELEAKVLRIIEHYTELERQRLYQEIVNKPGWKNDGELVDVPRQVWVPISHRLFMNDMYNRVKSENTLKRAIDHLVECHLIFQRLPDAKKKYDAAEYQLNTGAIDFLERVMAKPGGQKLIPSLVEGIKNLDPQNLIPSEYQKLLPSDFDLSVGRVSKIDPHIRYSNTKIRDKMCVVSRKPPVPKKTTVVSSPPAERHTHTSPPPSNSLELTPGGKRVIEFYQKLRKKPLLTEKIIKAASVLGDNDEVTQENLQLVLEQLDLDPWFEKHNVTPDLSWACERWDTCLKAGKKRREKENAAAQETSENDEEEEILRGWQEWVKQVERGEESVHHLVESNLPAYVLAMLPEQSRAEIHQNTQKRKESVLCTT